MTPFSLIREAPMRIRLLPTLWRVLACSALSTTLAVVLMAWQASRFCAERHHHEQDLRAVPWNVEWPTSEEIRTRMEIGCHALDTMRTNGTGLWATSARTGAATQPTSGAIGE